MAYKNIGDEKIRRLIMGFGLILISIGLVLVYSSNSSQPKKVGVRIARIEKEWSVQADLIRGDDIIVELRPAASWPYGLFDSDEYGNPTLYVFLNISNPEMRATRFGVSYRKTQTLVGVSNITVLQQDEGLDTTPVYNEEQKGYMAIGGIAMFNGTYKASVTHIFPERDDPPSSISIFRRDVVTDYPYRSFLPVGAVTAGVGGGISFFGLKRPRYKASTKKRKRLSRRQKHQ